MRRLALVMMAAGLPMAAFAQDAVIRIEAKRGDDAATETAARWAAEFDDVVTFALPRGWTAIALGPMTPAEAGRRIGELKEARQIPLDSFVAVPEADVVLTPVGDVVAGQAQPAGDAVAEVPAEPAPAADAVPAGAYIRLQSLATDAEAQEALATWRDTFPEAGLMRLPDGWSGVTLGPLDAAVAQVWLDRFKASGAVPRDAFVSDASDLLSVAEAGTVPDLPAAGTPQDLPPLDQVQRALRWAGVYDGVIDGKTGPKTREAIEAAITRLRLPPAEGAGMQALLARREAWRDQMGLAVLQDQPTGLSLAAPMDRLEFDRTERALSIYRPKDASGAALILFSQPGGQQELLDLSGLVTALGWVPQPERTIQNGHVLLQGANADHIGRAEGWVRDGRAEGFVLIWPAGDGDTQRQIAAEMSDSFARVGPAANETAEAAAVPASQP